MNSTIQNLALGLLSAQQMHETPPLMHRCFEQWVQAIADQPALVVGEQCLTYQAVNQRANQLAHYLSRQFTPARSKNNLSASTGAIPNISRSAIEKSSTKPTHYVAIWLEPSVERVVSLLAVLKAGAVVCPIHPSVPVNLLSDILQNLNCQQVLTTTTHLRDKNLMDASGNITESLPHASWRVLDQMQGQMQEELQDCANQNTDQNKDKSTDQNLSTDVDPDPLDTAYVIHTSGSTGIPKAVGMTHRAFSYEIYWQLRQSRNYAPLRTTQIASLGFDVFLTEVLSTLGNGGTLIVMPEAARTDGAVLLAQIQQHGIQRMLTSRIVLQKLAEESAKTGMIPESLQEIMCTGEQLVITPEIRSLFSQINCRLYNEYGMSENPVVTTFELTGMPHTWPERPPAGICADNTELLILDDNLQPVAPGEAGELYIGGEYLAQGYLNDPEKTAQSFVDHPFADESASGKKLLRSHDIGKIDNNGVITLLGRNDRVVKIHGVRIGLGEIESAIAQVANVSEAVVIKDAESEHDRLLAYVVMAGNSKKSDAAIRQHLTSVLPSHAIPAMFIQIDQIPLTHSGKVDRKSLPLPSTERPDIDTQFTAASSNTETQLVSVWSSVLNLAKVGINDNLYDLGGDSVSAAQLVAKVNDTFALALDTTAVYQFPTVALMAKHINQLKGEPQKTNVAAALAANNTSRAQSEASIHIQAQTQTQAQTQAQTQTQTQTHTKATGQSEADKIAQRRRRRRSAFRGEQTSASASHSNIDPASNP